MNAIEKLRLQSLSLKQEELIIEPITYQSKGAVPKVWCNIDSMLKMWGLDEYNPLYIVQKTEGRMPVQDNIHIDLTNIVYK